MSGTSSTQAAIVVLSLLAAERSRWVVEVLVGWVVVRLVVCWPVSWDVVVAVDMKKWFLRCWGGRGAETVPDGRLSTADSSLSAVRALRAARNLE